MAPNAASGRTVLIVDDERVIALDLQHTLCRMGYRAVTAASGEEALRVVETTPPDIVLMDLHLRKGLDGIETASQLRARCDFGLIYLTGSVGEEHKARARLTMPDAWLSKPYFLNALQEALRAVETQLSARAPCLTTPERR